MKTTTRKPAAKETAPKMVRCAIYTRKSTEEGLAMEFNSLDAQREAAEAFITSQRHEGWVVLPEQYDDGGYTGGNMERPALKRLLADVEGGKIDAIVVYKVDRLSRSLLDFSRLMEVLDRHACSFVSVTQQFNTTHSMGRLTLNILLSFAQFEREIIAERTKDKMSAARRKGKWVGGSLILGYDLNSERTRLVVNPTEAEQVRAIFRLYIEKQSILATAAELNSRGWPRKVWTGKRGTTVGGGPWNKPNLLGLLTNVTYLGKVAYGGEIYQGEHEAILDEKTWAATQTVLKRNQRDRSAGVRNKYGALLRGLLVCGTCGCAMTHSYSLKGKTRYRYYVCQKAMKRGWQECETKSVPAQEIEDFVIQRLARIGSDPELAESVAAVQRQLHLLTDDN
jgi:site-specific DNA recombinase